MRRWFRVGLRLGVVAGLATAVVKVIQGRRGQPESADTGWAPRAPAPEWTPQPPSPEPAKAAPPAKKAASKKGPAAPKAPAKASKTPAKTAKSVSKAAKVPPQTAKAAKTPKRPEASEGALRDETWMAVAWVEPEGNRCPTSHPVKAKLASRLFHLPGMLAYDRTKPDRCYEDEASAVSDGFTKARR